MTEPRQLTDAERVVGYLLLADASDYLLATAPQSDDARRVMENLRHNLIQESDSQGGLWAAQDHLAGADCTRWTMWRRFVSAEVRRG